MYICDRVLKEVNMETIFEKSLINSSATIEAVMRLKKPFMEFCNVVIEAMNKGNKIIFCGNGGSAADAQHLTAEFTGRFFLERRPLPAIALNTNVSAITAIANDYGYDEIFLRQTQALAQPGDVLVGISTSGNSKNIVKAFEYATSIGVTTVAFTGEAGGKMKEIADILLNVPSSCTPRVQEAHITMGHIMCEIVEQALFKDAQKAIPVQYKE